MSYTTTLTEIANLYAELGGGSPDERLQRVLYQKLSSAFSQLVVDLAKAPGWSAATGTATRTTFATGAVTLPRLAEAVKAIIDDHIARGDF